MLRPLRARCQKRRTKSNASRDFYDELCTTVETQVVPLHGRVLLAFFLPPTISTEMRGVKRWPRLSHRRAAKSAGDSTHSVVHKLLRENGLSIVLLALFFGSWLAQAFIGLALQPGSEGSRPRDCYITPQYLTGGHFIEATAENWESEFLQMAAFVWLTSFLFQKGSPESRDPHEPPETAPVTKKSPWPARAAGLR